ncbi:cryptochrome/photolyase family protein [Sphingomonas sp. ac-8]|uniref:cryptochrome/photolyase family protein n=1 Tax=Sphingomonas sp. ac-8 TaxID=3242977 RepID=UPI003A81165C
MTRSSPSIVWFRQDLRLADQAAFAAAAADGPVLAVYVLDDAAPGDWRIGAAQRWWLHHSLASLGEALAALGVPLVLRRGPAAATLAAIARETGAARIHCLAHYEPWWRAAEEALAEEVELVRHDGYLLIDPACVRSGAGTGYRMFAPFWRTLQDRMPPPAPAEAPDRVEGAKAPPGDALQSWKLLPDSPDWSGGFDDWTPGEAGAHDTLEDFVARIGSYEQDRNLPSIDGSSRLSPHLHMGEISPAAVWHAVQRRAGAQPFLRELAWRDFTSNLIVQLPDYADRNGRAKMDALAWRSGAAADADFRAWTKGRTGYPIVDAGMRQLWHSGWMHNRVRMLTASFLVKHLLIDWRRGERWFWDCLVDADYGNNSVNWQWVAGTGIDSSPFGRIMAPLAQSEKFDAADYIRRWVPELVGLSDADIHDPHGAGVAPAEYPEPRIGHRAARERALGRLASASGR